MFYIHAYGGIVDTANTLEEAEDALSVWDGDAWFYEVDDETGEVLS